MKQCMFSCRVTLVACACLLVLVASMAGSSMAQVPPGHHVYSALKVNGPFPGDAGVFVAHPRDAGKLTPITGLPEAITFSTYTGGGAVGANAVLFDPSTGGVVVGINGLPNQTQHLYRITLNGLAVASIQSIPLGTLVAGGGGVFQMAWIDPDELLVAAGAIDGPIGKPAVYQVGRVNLKNGAVTPVDLSALKPTAQFINALAYDRRTDTIYIGGSSGSSGVSEIFTMPLKKPGTPAKLVSLPGSVRGLALEADGDLIAGLSVVPASKNATLYRVSADGTTVTPLLLESAFANANSVAVEPDTGEVAIGGQSDASDLKSYGAYWFEQATQTTARLAIERSTGGVAGAVSGVDVAPAVLAYGSPSGRCEFRWSTAPDPRRLPRAGQVVRAAVDWPERCTPLCSTYAASLRPVDWRLPGGLRLLVDPFRRVAGGILHQDAPARQSVLELRLDARLKGCRIYVQSFHWTRRGWCASDGLDMSIL